MPRSVKHGGKSVYKFRALKNASKRKNKALKKKKTVRTSCEQLKNAWDHEMTVRQNVQAMGLVYDPNTAIPLKKKKKAALEDMEVGEVSTSEIKSIRAAEKSKFKKKQKKAQAPTELQVKASKVVEQLEQAAAEETEKQKVGREYKLQDRDIQFCVYMYTKHKDDYKAMSRDPKNIWQETPKQLEKKIRIYKQSPFYQALESMETE